jgi:oligopeptide/dipeptide ABC transporter ATP-binding protein
MYAGKIVESGVAEDILSAPKHPYTLGLIRSIPTLETQPKAKLPIIPGTVPALSELGSACRFANRCSFVKDICRDKQPPLENVAKDHQVACHFWKEIS